MKLGCCSDPHVFVSVFVFMSEFVVGLCLCLC